MGFEARIERALGRAAGPSTAFTQPIPEAPEPHFAYFFIRRLIDVTLSSVLLLLALPVILIASLVIVATSRRSPLLLQRRVGLRGETFVMLKLRTMRDGVEPSTPVRGRGGDAATPKTYGMAPLLPAKAPDDPRVTRAGSVLRRTSIDELPQLVNVLLGHMSLVGPRPMLPAEVDTMPDAWCRRFSVQPGLTGLWQVSGRSSLPVQRWMAFDRVYLQRRSLAFDFWLLLRTVGAVATMRGAW